MKRAITTFAPPPAALRGPPGLALAAALAIACGSSSSAPDSGTTEDAPIVDAFGGPKLGAPCVTSSECEPDGYCVEGSGGDVCTYDCDAGCPDGWSCRVTDVDGALVSLCMPQRFDLCKPCMTDAECAGGACIAIDGGGYCLPTCPFEGQCAAGYDCGPDPTGVHAGAFCVPANGSCTCTSAQDGQVRTCERTNAAGTCRGFETCNASAGGWSACTAPDAAAEICDGADNDCDQLIDDGVSGSSCQITVAGIGACPGVQLCTAAGVTCLGPTPVAETCNYTDDDCDGMIDEPFATLSMVCSAGIGGCERFGVIRCTSDGASTECSAVEGDELPEACNGIDDDCDTRLDEAFTTLGQSCSVGAGACARQGNLVCDASGAGTRCSVMEGTPGTESCNALDDDCDGTTDEGFRNAVTGKYDRDTTCGSCTNDCTVVFDLPNASGSCDASGVPRCLMVCDPNAFDLDGAVANGCELHVEPDSIYVSIDDVGAADDASCGLGPVGTGPGYHPCRTIAQGLTRAVATGRVTVRVANGIYAQPVVLVDGKNLVGGHQPDTWERDGVSSGTILSGVATIAGTNHDVTVRADAITTPTVLEGFVVLGPVNAKVGGNSYAIYVTTSSANLVIRNNAVYGGRGGPGAIGGAGASGPAGVAGNGRDASPAAYDAFTATGTGACDATNNRAYANGGPLLCGLDDVSGGAGGGNRCPASAGAGAFPQQPSEASGIDGVGGQIGAPALGGAAGAGADAGDDGYLFKNGPSAACYVPLAPDYGRDGSDGRDAGHGIAGAGCSSVAGSVVNGHWVGTVAATGGTGGNGGGGGGGGAGGGAHCDTNAGSSCQGGKDVLGGHGGGGGSGGCGAGGGTGATAGGGAFDVFVVGGTAPVIVANTLQRGEGGRGGTGGAGGQGGAGGIGAPGGTSAVFCAGRAGRGGNGGDGGHGGGGGGGCGGSSFGVFTSGVGSPNYCTAGASNTIGGGAGGAGGAGGYALINPGAAGSGGTLVTCQFN